MLGSAHIHNPIATALRYAAVRDNSDRMRGEDQIMDGVIDFYTDPIDARILEWAQIWAPQITGPMSNANLPEIALEMSITSKHNLRITWTPIMTKEQFIASSPEFKFWMEDVRWGYPKHIPNELLFIRDIRSSWARAHKARESGADSYDHPSLLAATTLRELLVDMPRIMDMFVNAYWQDVITSDSNYPSMPAIENVVAAEATLYKSEPNIPNASCDNSPSSSIKWSRRSYADALAMVTRSRSAS